MKYKGEQRKYNGEQRKYKRNHKGKTKEMLSSQHILREGGVQIRETLMADLVGGVLLRIS